MTIKETMETLVRRILLLRKNSSKYKCTEGESSKHANDYGANVMISPFARVYKETRIENFAGINGAIMIGDHSHCRGHLLTYWSGGRIEIGQKTYIGESTRIWSQQSVKIGNHVLISHMVDIHDSDSHPIDHLDRRKDIESILCGSPYSRPVLPASSSVIIEDDVWICLKATILKGVTIGEGSIVAANSVVTRDIEPFTLVAGAPAQAVRRLKGHRKQ